MLSQASLLAVVASFLSQKAQASLKVGLLSDLHLHLKYDPF